MVNDKTKKFIKDVNDSYLKVLENDIKEERKEKKRLEEEYKDLSFEAYKEILKEEK